jgi:hypothetical protein
MASWINKYVGCLKSADKTNQEEGKVLTPEQNRFSAFGHHVLITEAKEGGRKRKRYVCREF